jgi:hypothetical protein
MRVEVGFSAAGRRRWRRRGPLGQDSRASEARLGCPQSSTPSCLWLSNPAVAEAVML